MIGAKGYASLRATLVILTEGRVRPFEKVRPMKWDPGHVVLQELRRRMLSVFYFPFSHTSFCLLLFIFFSFNFLFLLC